MTADFGVVACPPCQMCRSQQDGFQLLCQAFEADPSQPGVLNLLAAHSLAQGNSAQVLRSPSEAWLPVHAACCPFHRATVLAYTLDKGRHLGQCSNNSSKVPRRLGQPSQALCLPSRTPDDAQAKELAEQAVGLTASAALKADAQVVLARAHHARRELAAAQKLYTLVSL